LTPARAPRRSAHPDRFRSIANRGDGSLHGEVHAERALRLVPRHDRQPHGRRHHRARVRGEVRWSQEGGGGDSLPARIPVPGAAGAGPPDGPARSGRGQR